MIDGLPLQRVMMTSNGFLERLWRGWFQSVQNVLGKDSFPLNSYTVSGVPDATLHEGGIIYVSDETGGATVAFSDGTNWRRVQDRNIIS